MVVLRPITYIREYKYNNNYILSCFDDLCDLCFLVKSCKTIKDISNNQIVTVDKSNQNNRRFTRSKSIISINRNLQDIILELNIYTNNKCKICNIPQYLHNNALDNMIIKHDFTSK